MFEINGNNIIVIKGDTGEFTLTIDNYTFRDGDKVYMTVKSKMTNSEYVFQKVVTDFIENRAVFKLTHEDTNIQERTYIYDIQCSLTDGRIDTVIPPSQLVVLSGVTDDR